MTETQTIESETSIDASIQSEALALGAILGINQSQIERTTAHCRFDEYAEFVVTETGMEIVCGGIDRSDELARSAQQLGLSNQAIGAFSQLTSLYPRRMAHLKLAIEPSPTAPALYLTS